MTGKGINKIISISSIHYLLLENILIKKMVLSINVEWRSQVLIKDCSNFKVMFRILSNCYIFVDVDVKQVIWFHFWPYWYSQFSISCRCRVPLNIKYYIFINFRILIIVDNGTKELIADNHFLGVYFI